MIDTIEIDAADRAWARSGLCGDAYYRLLAAWIASARTNGSATEVRRIGLLYADALDRYLECLAKLTPSAALQRNFPNGLEYKSYLESGLELLSSVAAEEPADVYEIEGLGRDGEDRPIPDGQQLAA